MNFNSIIVNYRYLMQPFIERSENKGLSSKQQMQLNGYIFFSQPLISIRNQIIAKSNFILRLADATTRLQKK